MSHDLPHEAQSIIEHRVRAILFRSTLPVERRAEVAQEMRSHLEESVSQHRDDGLSPSESIEMALTEFGNPRRIRRQLRRNQRHLDQNTALRELSGSLGFALLPAALIAASQGLTMTGVPIQTRCAVSVSMFVCLSVGLAFPAMILFAFFRTRVQRSSPRDEYVFARSLFQWAIVLCASLAALAGVSAVLYAAGSALWDSTPLVELCRNALRYDSPQWWSASALRAASIAPVVLLAAVLLALYERSRCVDSASESDREPRPSMG